MSDDPDFEAQYLALLRDLLAAPARGDRTGVGTRGLFARQLRCDLRREVPLLTTKRVFARGALVELIWMLRGRCDVEFLRERGVRIWDEWQGKGGGGGLGPVYGKQWRGWTRRRPAGGEYGVDQIAALLEQLRGSPTSRRMVVSAWNVADLPEMSLPPCPCLFQCWVGADDRVSMQVYQRSADAFLGLPFDCFEYGLLLLMLANACGRAAGELVMQLGDVHLYLNHEAAAREQLSRQPLWQKPHVQLSRERDWASSDLSDLDESDVLIAYASHPAIAAQVAV